MEIDDDILRLPVLLTEEAEAEADLQTMVQIIVLDHVLGILL